VTPSRPSWHKISCPDHIVRRRNVVSGSWRRVSVNKKCYLCGFFFDYIVLAIQSAVHIVPIVHITVHIHTAMQSAVIARGVPSVRSSRSGIVSRWMKIRSCGFQHLVAVRLVSGEVGLSFFGYSQCIIPSGDIKVRRLHVENLTNNRP